MKWLAIECQRLKSNADTLEISPKDKELLGLCQKSVLRDDQGKKEQLWNMTGIGIEQTEVDTSRSAGQKNPLML